MPTGACRPARCRPQQLIFNANSRRAARWADLRDADSASAACRRRCAAATCGAPSWMAPIAAGGSERKLIVQELERATGWEPGINQGLRSPRHQHNAGVDEAQAGRWPQAERLFGEAIRRSQTSHELDRKRTQPWRTGNETRQLRICCTQPISRIARRQ